MESLLRVHSQDINNIAFYKFVTRNMLFCEHKPRCYEFHDNATIVAMEEISLPPRDPFDIRSLKEENRSYLARSIGSLGHINLKPTKIKLAQ